MNPYYKTAADKLRIEVYENRKEMGEAAAQCGAVRVRKAIEERGEANVIFAAAPSQFELYDSLLCSGLDFSKMNAFHMDEYLGLDSDAPQAFGNLLKTHLFSKQSFKSVYYINGQTEDPQAECRRYAELLAQFLPDVIFHGIGENGHLAFNDPPAADFSDLKIVKVVEMDEICRNQQVHDGCFAQNSLVPRQAISLTIPVLTRKDALLVVTVPGSAKSAAVHRTVFDEISTSCPATILRRHPNAALFLDKDSAEGILS